MSKKKTLTSTYNTCSASSALARSQRKSAFVTLALQHLILNAKRLVNKINKEITRKRTN